MRIHGATVRYLIRDRDSKYAAAFDTVLQDEGIAIAKTGIRVPRMNAIVERWVRSCRAELLVQTLIVNQAHLLHALREYETFYNEHRSHRALHGAAPLRPLAQLISTRSTRPPRHTTTRSTRRHLPRIRTCRLTWQDGLSGTYRVRERKVSALDASVGGLAPRVGAGFSWPAV
ncbi:integrase core domain-containing protein [Dactylosporangium sp. NBC_01737]|uniref:integrase core domain-containing protein n=1 Tax=Dactylosporangium sp. NBC_01737 TaxID=2975959 RepID=UPI002E0FB254|nr:integrase core domain-containing protein [Dactylosporangium sp. NBC_01737]